METVQREQTATESPASQNEVDVQRRLDRAKQHAETARFQDAVVLEFNVSQTDEMMDLRLEQEGLEFVFNLYDHYGLDAGLSKANTLAEQEKAYMPLLIINYAGKTRPFTTGLYASREKARNSLPNDHRTRDELTFRFSDDDAEELRYGLLTSLRQHLPDPLEKRFNSAFFIIGLMLAVPAVGMLIHGGVAIASLVLMMIAMLSVERYEEWASIIDEVDLEDVYERSRSDREFDVVTCEFESTADEIVIRSAEHDATWTFEKTAMGDLSEKGKEALEAVSMEGDECIACISSSRIDEANRLESDCGEWKLEQLD